MLLLLALFLVAAASPIRNKSEARDGADVNGAVHIISNQPVTLNETLDEFNAGIEGTVIALKILDQSDKLGKQIDQSTNIVKSSDSLDDTESTTVAYSTVELSSNVYEVLDHIIVKKPDFDKAVFGVGSGSFLVKGTLESLRNKTAGFGSALQTKFVKQIADLSPLVLATIDFRFQQALRIYK